MERVLSKRQPDLCLVIDNIHDAHNVAALLRSCDAFGVMDVHLLYTRHPMPRTGGFRSKAAASALKWLRITKWDSAEELIRFLKKKKFAIAVTDLSSKAVDPKDADLAQPVVLVLGNEHEGVSPELTKAADINLRLPMVGFVQSFNVSVAGALLLYEAYRQREKAGLYEKTRMKVGERREIWKKWTA
jgi:tRNA (guanosine-2'-O-)-methyltransferase